MKVAPRARWYIRIFQFSPIVAAALLAAVWLSVPVGLRAQVDSFREFSALADAKGRDSDVGFSEKDLAEQWFAQSRVRDELEIPANAVSMAFDDMSTSVLEGVAKRASALFSTDGETATPSWSADDEIFASAHEFEETYGARVYVYFVPNPRAPELVASAVPRTDLLPSYSETLETYDPASGMSDEEATDRASRPWMISWWRNLEMYGEQAPLPGILDSAIGCGSEKYTSSEAIRSPGRIPYYYVWFSPPAPTDNQQTTTPADLESDPVFFTIDPMSPTYQERLDEAAREYNCDIFVAGPLDLRLIPVRVPDGTTLERARSLGNAIWPADASRGSAYYGIVEQLPAESREFADGADWMMSTMLPGGTAQIALTSTRTSESGSTPPQTVVVLATMKETPSAISADELSPLARLWQDVQIFLALQQAPLLGGASLLLAMALVASPAAFIVERHRITQALVLEEMERVQQDAHDKVYNRLSALSKRVEIASESISTEVTRSLDGVAEDIRDTVTDLQDILGDARQRTASLTGNDPLRSQLESVAREQAARLSVTVHLTVTDAMPTLSAQVGWDLQCVLEEAISNAVEHGQATHVTASVDVENESLRLQVSDDGSGMPTETLADLPEESMGLRGMHNRAERHGGTFTAKSTDSGTTIEVRIPVKGNRGD
jgi:signal transduction histidine kinase